MVVKVVNDLIPGIRIDVLMHGEFELSCCILSIATKGYFNLRCNNKVGLQGIK